MLAPSKVEVQYQPVGVVGIIVPWNFPLFLALSPATQALAAGNRVMIKLSEFTPNTNKVLIKATQCIKDHLIITEGERETGAAFSALPFDHLVFTGSTTVGRYVAKAAADNLTPITLELGGKSPVIFAEDANWETAIDGVILGKAINSGQICVSPRLCARSLVAKKGPLFVYSKSAIKRILPTLKTGMSRLILLIRNNMSGCKGS